MFHLSIFISSTDITLDNSVYFNLKKLIFDAIIELGAHLKAVTLPAAGYMGNAYCYS